VAVVDTLRYRIGADDQELQAALARTRESFRRTAQDTSRAVKETNQEVGQLGKLLRKNLGAQAVAQNVGKLGNAFGGVTKEVAGVGSAVVQGLAQAGPAGAALGAFTALVGVATEKLQRKKEAAEEAGKAATERTNEATAALRREVEELDKALARRRALNVAANEGRSIEEATRALSARELQRQLPTLEREAALAEKRVADLQKQRESLVDLREQLSKGVFANPLLGDVKSQIESLDNALGRALTQEAEAVAARDKARKASARIATEIENETLERALENIKKRKEADEKAAEDRARAAVAARAREEEAQRRLFESTAEGLQREIALLDRKAPLEVLLYDLEEGNLRGLSADRKQKIRDIGEELDARRATAAALDEMNRLADEHAAAVARINEAALDTIEARQRDLDLAALSTEEARTRYEIEQGRFRDFEKWQKDELVRLAQVADANKAAADAEASRRQAALESQRQMQAEMQQMQMIGQGVAFSLADTWIDSFFDPQAKSWAQWALDTTRNISKVIAQMLILRGVSALVGGAPMPGLGGGVAGFADGGMVSGPGTATSDSIPARLSAGEYVVRAAAVQKYGAGLLEAINRGAYPRAAAGVSVPTTRRYAEGGLVAGQGGVRIVNVVDPSLVSGFMRSSEGEQVIVNAIAANPDRVRAAIGG